VTGTRCAWPKRTTLPIWQHLLDAGADTWVTNTDLLAAIPQTLRSNLSGTLLRWRSRGWVDREIGGGGGNRVRWRLTLHGRQQVRRMLADVARDAELREHREVSGGRP
jgi:hypothetical protein